MSTGQTLVSQCEHCGGILEINIAQIGKQGRCYHCGLQTNLDPTLTADADSIPFRPAGAQVNKVKSMLFGIAVVAVVWNLFFLAFILMPEGEQQLMQLLERAIPWINADAR